MGNKHDMFIDYKRSDKKRGRRSKRKVWLGLWVIIIVVGFGLTAYILVKPKLALHSQEENLDKKQFVAIPSEVLPTNKPTDQPVKATTNDNVKNDTSDIVPKSPEAIKGIYVPAKAAGSNHIYDLMEMAASTEINAMVIDVKDDHGRISYEMDCDMAKEIGAVTNTISDMDQLVKRLKEKNIYLIARIVAFKDPYLAEKREDLAITNMDGSLYKDSNGEGWVNPYNKKVWNYLVDVASHAAASGFDEIQFDYIRFSTSKAIAKADLGEEAKKKSKEKIITEFTKFAYEKLKPLGIYVSADVYGTIIASSVDAGLVGQNYVEMSKYLDYICPMIYPSHFSEGNLGVQYPDQEPFKIISKVLSISAQKLSELPKGQHHAVVRPWLQDFTATWVKHHLDYGGEELREEIEGVYSVGYGEWLLWNAGCDYSEDGLLEE